jgi:hypothetical protein
MGTWLTRLLTFMTQLTGSSDILGDMLRLKGHLGHDSDFTRTVIEHASHSFLPRRGSPIKHRRHVHDICWQ